MKQFFDIPTKSIFMPIDRDFNFKIKFFKIFLNTNRTNKKLSQKLTIKHAVCRVSPVQKSKRKIKPDLQKPNIAKQLYEKKFDSLGGGGKKSSSDTVHLILSHSCPYTHNIFFGVKLS